MPEFERGQQMDRYTADDLDAAAMSDAVRPTGLADEIPEALYAAIHGNCFGASAVDALSCHIVDSPPSSGTARMSSRFRKEA